MCLLFSLCDASSVVRGLTSVVPTFPSLSCKAILVNHHGSSHSTNQFYVDTLLPQVAFISCGDGNSHNHPAQPVLDKLHLADSQMFLNNICAHDRNYYNSVIENGDIVLRSKTGHDFHVGAKHYRSKNAATVQQEAEAQPAVVEE